MTEIVVTQADRKACEEWRRNWYSCEGAWLALDEAFAQHRIASTAAFEADNARLREALDALTSSAYKWMIEDAEDALDSQTARIRIGELSSGKVRTVSGAELEARLAAMIEE